jgi:hypothetical protein
MVLVNQKAVVRLGDFIGRHQLVLGQIVGRRKECEQFP